MTGDNWKMTNGKWPFLAKPDLTQQSPFLVGRANHRRTCRYRLRSFVQLIRLNSGANILQLGNDSSAVFKSPVCLVIAVLDFLIGHDRKSPETKIEVLIDHHAVAKNQIKLFVTQPNARHSVLHHLLPSEGAG